MSKKQTPLNALDKGEVAPCLTSNYYKVGWSDFLPDIPCKHLAILEIMEPQIKQIGSYSPSSACNAKVLDPDGICPTLLNHKGAEPAILTPHRTGTAKQLRHEGIETFAHRELVPREDGVCNTLTSVLKDNMLLEPKTCAIRGRGENNEQRLEIGRAETANCITSVQKDSMVIEKTSVDYEYRLMPNGNIRAYNPASRNYEKGVTGYHITNPENVADTVIATHKPNIIEQKKQGKTMYRIRKLTPKECFRLMDVDDESIEKIEAYPWRSYAEREEALKGLPEKERKRELRKGISKSAKYKLAGNSICVGVLYEIFRTLFIPGQPENDSLPVQLSLFD